VRIQDPVTNGNVAPSSPHPLRGALSEAQQLIAPESGTASRRGSKGRRSLHFSYLYTLSCSERPSWSSFRTSLLVESSESSSGLILLTLHLGTPAKSANPAPGVLPEPIPWKIRSMEGSGGGETAMRSTAGPSICWSHNLKYAGRRPPGTHSVEPWSMKELQHKPGFGS
jgi:hypothetical protein